MSKVLSISLAIISAFCCAALIQAQASSDDSNVLPPPRKDLVAVHWPGLTNLESDVRQQLTSLQSSRSVTVKNRATSESKLAEVYGTMREIYQAYALGGFFLKIHLQPRSTLLLVCRLLF